MYRDNSGGSLSAASLENSNGSLYYWREANEEIDFIIEKFKKLYPSSEFLPISNEFSNSWEQYLKLK